jgi:uncharacterized membrane protein
MKKIILSSVFSILFLANFVVFATNDAPVSANANLQGKVIDKQTGESLAGVVITVNGTNVKVYSDLDGNYSIKGLKPGKYTVIVNYISYRKDSREIEVKDNESKNINILLEPVKS